MRAPPRRAVTPKGSHTDQLSSHFIAIIRVEWLGWQCSESKWHQLHLPEQGPFLGQTLWGTLSA